jgi:hypothetical protein
MKIFALILWTILLRANGCNRVLYYGPIINILYLLSYSTFEKKILVVECKFRTKEWDSKRGIYLHKNFISFNVKSHHFL